MIKAVGPRISLPISPAVVAGNIFFATNVPVDLQTGKATKAATIEGVKGDVKDIAILPAM